MVKQSKHAKDSEEPRQVGPKFARNVIPSSFQIRRAQSPMAQLLDEASARATPDAPAKKQETGTGVKSTPVKLTGVKSTPVEFTGVIVEEVDTGQAKALPDLTEFLDRILPLFPPARQAILLRIYRWSEGFERNVVVSTPRLAAKTNMDEKSCRTHLHGLISDGYLLREMDGEQIARFGGSDRGARGLILRLDSLALTELLTRT